MEKVQKEGRMKRKNIKIIAGIVLLLAFAGIGAYVIVKSKFVCKFIFQLCGFIYATFIFKRFD